MCVSEVRAFHLPGLAAKVRAAPAGCKEAQSQQVASPRPAMPAVAGEPAAPPTWRLGMRGPLGAARASDPSRQQIWAWNWFQPVLETCLQHHGSGPCGRCVKFGLVQHLVPSTSTCQFVLRGLQILLVLMCSLSLRPASFCSQDSHKSCSSLWL